MTGDISQLKQMQVYVGREMVEEFRAGHISRRVLIKRLIMICGSASSAAALLAACDKDVDGGVDSERTGGSGGSAPGAGGGGSGGAGGGDAGNPGSDGGTGAGADMGPGVLSVPANDPAVTTSRVTYPSAAGNVIAYLARPKVAGPFPAVVVIHENRGLNDHIRDVARRLAKASFVALAPDLTSRGGSTEMLDPDMARMFLSNAEPADLVADLSAGVDFVLSQTGIRPTGKVGVVGFCLGGGYTLRLAAANQKVGAAVPYYGPAPMPIEMMKTTSAAILAHYADMDMNVNATREQLEMVLLAAGKTFQKSIHPGTRHAFNNDTGANYNEGAAVAAWEETLAWFNALLV
jgi:carboxymethylenebutenolidase